MKFDEGSTTLDSLLRTSVPRSSISTLSSKQSLSFRWRDVEPLIEQGAALLGHALATRREWMQAGEKWAALEMADIETLADRDVAEIRKGVADKRAEAAGKRADAEDALSAGLRLAISKAGDLRKRAEVDVKEQNGSVQVWRRGVMAYCAAPFGDNKVPAETDPGDDEYPTRWNLVTYGKPDVARELTERDVRYDLKTARISAEMHAQELGASQAASTHRRNAETSTKEAESAEGRAVDRHLQRADKLFTTRTKMRDDAYLLGFARQIESARGRFFEYTMEAHERLEIASRGLEELYEYKDEFPQIDSNKEFVEIEQFDRLFRWTLRAAAFLAWLARQSDTVVVPVSLRAILGDKWDVLLKGKDSVEAAITPQYLADLGRAMRLRGSGFDTRGLEGKNLDARGMFRLTVTPPKVGIYSGISGKPSMFGQPCSALTLACPSGPQASRASAVADWAPVVHNLTPLGTWTFRLAIPEIGDHARPSDILVLLHLAVVPTPTE